MLRSPAPELPPGITSLPEALSLAIAWLDGDATSSEDASSQTPSDAPTTHQTPIERAIALLTTVQHEMSRNGMLSKNEVLDDIPTSTVGLLDVEYQLARAHLALPTHAPPPVANDVTSNGGHKNTASGANPSLLRKRNVTRAIELYHLFLKRLEQLGEGMLPEATLKEYHSVLDQEDTEESTSRQSPRTNPAQVREMKIQRFQRKKAATLKQSQLQSQLQRRSRLGLAEGDLLEGHDAESLSRTLFVEALRAHAEESLEEIQSSRGELEMLEMAIRMDSARVRGADSRMTSGHARRDRATAPQAGLPPPRGKQPLQMTQITQHPVTGQLEYTQQRVSNGQLAPVQSIRRQDIGATVFRPSWNQPTMSLAELGERERAEAIQRSEAQEAAEAAAEDRPRRYEQLANDGREDDAGLVEASAAVDRAWDDWKEENPRGSGNKMAERGDRNF